MKLKRDSFFDNLACACFTACTVIFIICAVIIFKMTNTNILSQVNTAVEIQNYTPAQKLSKNISVSSKGMCLIDGKTGAVLLECNKDGVYPMASTTKIMTALIALETLQPDRIIEVNKKACGVEGSSIYLSPGEKITCLDLVYGLMLESGNDAAAALAYEISGGTEEFALLMNKRAKELGLENTSFTNPHGLSHPDHYTTAYELALICAEAYKNPTFTEIAKTRNYTCASDLKVYNFSNHNKLLSLYDGAVGVKTGYTQNAGRCLASAAVRDNSLFICVTLGAHDDWNIHKNCLDAAFSSFKTVTLAKANSFYVTHNGVTYTNRDEINITQSTESKETYSYKTVIRNNIPIVTVYSQDYELASFELCPKSDIKSE